MAAAWVEWEIWEEWASDLTVSTADYSGVKSRCCFGGMAFTPARIDAGRYFLGPSRASRRKSLLMPASGEPAAPMYGHLLRVQ